MQVLLKADVQKLGYRGDIIDVKKGYFRNFLFPNNLAEVSTKKMAELAEKRRETMVMRKQQVVENSREVLDKLKGLSVTVKGKVSDKGKLYASITESDIVEAIKEAAKLELEKGFIKMDHFKELGEYEVVVHLGADMEEKVKVVVEEEV